MRTLALLALGAALAAPAAAQNRTTARSSSVLGLDEIVPFGTQRIRYVIERTRPRFLQPDPSAAAAGSTRSGITTVSRRWRLLVYVDSETRPQDASVLDSYRADQVAEVRYYRVSEAATRFATDDNSSVIQLILRDSPWDGPPRRDSLSRR
ncbi:MAG: hypothetical protein ACJ8AO_11555 [Gemmatimonadaceae bacterium]